MQYQNPIRDCQLLMLKQVYEPLWGLLFPETCPRCGGPTSTGFCTPCRHDFPRNIRACRYCGIGPLPSGAKVCAQHNPAWQTDQILAPLLFAWPLERYIYALKFGGQRALGRALGQILAESAAPQRCNIDAIVSVPLHPRRLLQRGYNQALEIARSVSAQLHIPILRAGIQRCKATPPQSRLTAAQRQQNIAGAFAVRRDLSGRRVAIIDDVITTGATVNALANAIRAAGATRVEAWAVARTPLPPV